MKQVVMYVATMRSSKIKNIYKNGMKCHPYNISAKGKNTSNIHITCFENNY